MLNARQPLRYASKTAVKTCCKKPSRSFFTQTCSLSLTPAHRSQHKTARTALLVSVLHCPLPLDNKDRCRQAATAFVAIE